MRRIAHPICSTFANRSFIAKQVEVSIRDIGATIRYNLKTKFPLVIEAGLFSGAGFAFHKDFWTDRISYAAKLQSSPTWPQAVSIHSEMQTDRHGYVYTFSRIPHSLTAMTDGIRGGIHSNITKVGLSVRVGL